jgi:signal transduction histidine kinase/DNA-binding response OmpR family regulator
VAADQEPGAPVDLRVERLTRDLSEAIEQQAATSEVLEVIGRGEFELQPVFETVVRHAVRLCDADAGMVHQLDGDVYRLAHLLGGPEAYRAELERQAIVQDAGTLVGRVGLERRTVQIPDVLADPDYQWHRARELGGFRTYLGVPIVAAGRVVGVITLLRDEVEQFDDQTIALANTFAAQGAIAIQNVQLFQALQQRGRDLARSVDELRALGEVSQAVSSSRDLDEMLTTIVTQAVRLSDTDGGSIFEFNAQTRAFEVRTCVGTSEELIETLGALRIHVDETFVGRAALGGQPLQAPDLDLERLDAHTEALRRHGWRSLLAVPLMREDEIIGALIVRRTEPGEFTQETSALLETLASQSAVAIHNARLFRELEVKTDQLEIASRHKSEFLASMSHELRTPLNAVIGFSDVLLERMFGELNERQEEYLRDIRSSGHHLLELINEILDLSKVEAGRMDLELGPVSLAEAIDHGLAMVRERAARHGISLRRDIAGDIGMVWADELKLRQVLLNLLTNAVKFTPDGGSVEIAARVTDGEVEVSVTDTGIGIAEAERERIFEAFQRGGRTAPTGAEGTGLGLTLTRQIVELHGGRIWMTSTPGEGSTFAFALPRHEARRAAADDAAEAGTAGTVVVIEDDRRSADLLTLYLEGAGYAVLVAGDGVDGLELVRRVEPVAVILDVRLPRLDGWDVLARLKADPATASLPVVIVSMIDERGRGFALGAAEYLVKPVDRERFLSALERYVPARTDRPTVVVIDDDPIDLDLVEAILAPAGYSVLRAAGGEEGVALVAREQPAVVLLDLLMPGVDGFAVIERLRADPETAEVPIVVLTAKEMTGDDRVRLAGQIDYLAQKGAFGGKQLVALVGHLCESGGHREVAR